MHGSGANPARSQYADLYPHSSCTEETLSQIPGPRLQKQVSVQTAKQLLQLFWPDFIEVNGCIFAAFQCYGDVEELPGGKTETESFINHTHVLDEFQNGATSENRESVSESLGAVEESYDHTHADFVAACEIGSTMTKMWAIKLKLDYPERRFRVYYTQYDNPIVRFHQVRTHEPVWLTDDALHAATDPSFRNAIIYDTDYLEQPVTRTAPIYLH